jgi:hypothetical protein
VILRLSKMLRIASFSSSKNLGSIMFITAENYKRKSPL